MKLVGRNPTVMSVEMTTLLMKPLMKPLMTQQLLKASRPPPLLLKASLLLLSRLLQKLRIASKN